MAGIKEAIKSVLTKARKKSELEKMGMAEGKSLSSYSLSYDAPSSVLEPIYFWILDFIQEMGITDITKVTDNFTSSPGSGHFAEMGMRATRMQEEGMKILGMVNQVIKTVLNLIYDLKEFEIRLGHYEDARSADKEKKEAGVLSLKQIWLDQVDIKRGRGSIHQMAYEGGFTTLREAFMVANSIDDIKKMSGNEGVINEQVKRILIPRMAEFLKWKEFSEKELRKRFEIEKSYLKTEVESLKLYTSWVRPYLKAAEELRQKGFEKNPALVHAFNTAMFELVLFVKKEINFKSAVQAKNLPPGFANYTPKRKYYSCGVISLVFRGFPQKVTQQHYGFGGNVDIKFDSYALNDEEIAMINKELEKEDVAESLGFIQEATDLSLKELEEDIGHFLNKERHEEKKIKSDEPQNPFSALFKFFKIKKKEKKISDAKEIKKDNFIEQALRKLAAEKAVDNLYSVYDIYKKSHGMASSREAFR